MPLQDFQKQWVIQQMGLDPSQYDLDDMNQVIEKTPSQPALNHQTIDEKPPVFQPPKAPVETFARSFIHAAPTAALGGLGAGVGWGLGAGLAGPSGGLSLLLPLALSALGAYGGAKLGGKAQQSLEEQFVPEQQRQQFALQQQQNPLAAKLGGIAAMPVGGFGATPGSLATTGSGAIKALIGQNLTPLERYYLQNSLVGGSLGAGMNILGDVAEGRPVTPSSVAESALLGVAFNKPNALAKFYGFHNQQPIDIQASVQELRQPSPEDLQRTGVKSMTPEEFMSVAGIPIERGLKAYVDENGITRYTPAGDVMSKYKGNQGVSEEELQRMGEEGGIVPPEAEEGQGPILPKEVIEAKQREQRIIDFFKGRMEVLNKQMQAALKMRPKPKPVEAPEKERFMEGGTILKGNIPPPYEASSYKPTKLMEQSTSNLPAEAPKEEGVMTPYERGVIGEIKGQQKPYVPTRKFFDIFKDWGINMKGITVDDQGIPISESTGKPIPGVTLLENGLPKLIKLNTTGDNPKQLANATTPMHELEHAYEAVLESDKNPTSQKFMRDYTNLIAASPEFKAWAEARTAAGQNASVKEYRATNNGYEFLERGLNLKGENPIKRWWKDVSSYMKTRLGKYATEEDYRRILNYNTMYDPRSLPEIAGVKSLAPTGVGASQVEQQRQEESNLPSKQEKKTYLDFSSMPTPILNKYIDWMNKIHDERASQAEILSARNDVSQSIMDSYGPAKHATLFGPLDKLAYGKATQEDADQFNTNINVVPVKAGFQEEKDIAFKPTTKSYKLPVFGETKEKVGIAPTQLPEGEMRERLKESTLQHPVYHYTPYDFERADPTEAAKQSIHSVLGMHFGDEQAAAEKSWPREGARTQRYWLDLRNPLHVTDEQANIPDALADHLHLDKTLLDDNEFADYNRIAPHDIKARGQWLQDHLMRLGYDGLVYNNMVENAGSKSYTVFRKNQVINALNPKREPGTEELYQEESNLPWEPTKEMLKEQEDRYINSYNKYQILTEGSTAESIRDKIGSYIRGGTFAPGLSDPEIKRVNNDLNVAIYGRNGWKSPLHSNLANLFRYGNLTGDQFSYNDTTYRSGTSQEKKVVLTKETTDWIKKYFADELNSTVEQKFHADNGIEAFMLRHIPEDLLPMVDVPSEETSVEFPKKGKDQSGYQKGDKVSYSHLETELENFYPSIREELWKRDPELAYWYESHTNQAPGIDKIEYLYNRNTPLDDELRKEREKESKFFAGKNIPYKNRIPSEQSAIDDLVRETLRAKYSDEEYEIRHVLGKSPAEKEAEATEEAFKNYINTSAAFNEFVPQDIELRDLMRKHGHTLSHMAGEAARFGNRIRNNPPEGVSLRDLTHEERLKFFKEYKESLKNIEEPLSDTMKKAKEEMDRIYGQTQEQSESFLPALIRPEIDKVGELDSPEAPKVAKALRGFYDERRRYTGILTNPVVTDLMKHIPLTNLKGLYFQNIPEFERVVKRRFDMQDKGYSSINLNAKEQEIDNIVKDSLLKSWNEMQSIPTLKKLTNPDPNYFPQMPKRSVLSILLGNEGTPTERRALIADWHNYYTNVLKKSRAESDNNLKIFMEGYGKQEHNLAEQFGPIDKASGLGLPRSWRSTDLVDVMSRFNSRYGRRLAYEKAIQSDPDVVDALHNPETGLGRADVVKNVMNDIMGNRETEESLRTALSGVWRALQLGPLTGAKDFVTNLTLGMQHETLPQTLITPFKALSDLRNNIKESLDAGVNRPNIAALELPENGWGTIDNHLRRLRDVITTFDGRNILEKVTRATAFGKGKLIAMDNLWSAKQGNADPTQLKFLDDFAPGWQQYKQSGQFPSDVLQEVAAKYTESVQGRYDYRGLPSIAQKGTLAPYLSLARWNIEKLNNFDKYVIQPARKGNYRPLLMMTLGSVIGGEAVNQLVQLLTGRKEKTPTMSELQELSQEKGETNLSGAVLYKAAALASLSGYAGLLGDLSKASLDWYNKNHAQTYNNPLISGVTTIAQNTGDVINAFRNGDLNIGLDAISQVLQDLFQAYRIGYNFLDPEKIKELEKTNKLRDLKVFKQTHGLPVGEVTSDRANPFLNQDIKKFKQTSSMTQAIQSLPSLLQKAFEKAKGNPDVLKAELMKLKINNYQTMPSIDSLEFAKYLTFLEQTQGKTVAANRLKDYLLQNEINKEKSQLVPTL